ncbi:hypothetical protein LMG8520_2087 [Lactococcus lactis subsp. lactis]|uniref:Thioredoxin domain-containing protein n=2 Tax=Lactococcus lactis TaxID=1358 RepID=A0A2A5S8V8_LACLH|nr:hypothetical protein [Lactococcus lactis]KAA8699964.1 hypothetical protein F4V48_11130 [Lactococcus lactis subsp. hordniae]KSU06385.1 hypothetical protein LMG8520_2087 [Lactococcus lactis subsp. lactis]MCT3134431.1 hypothetical protein [Lactococcus lactis]PCS09936.1 hypothetical protein RU90_GL001631 [Lactococcus lactis subsp. hordniae]PCS09943.1 hypothetical protein RU90_GL001638 [Lactococcus lactis subsp. hordniae]
MKNFIQKKFLKWKYSDDTMYLTARKSVRIGIGLLLLVVGIFIIFQVFPKHDYKYSSIDSTPKEAMSKLESSNQKDLTLVLYRDDCKYCQKVEKPLVKKISGLKKELRKNVVVMNVNEMSTNELKSFKNMIPAILVEGDKIPTPLVANLKLKSKNEITVLSKSETGELSEISNLIH